MTAIIESRNETTMLYCVHSDEGQSRLLIIKKVKWPMQGGKRICCEYRLYAENMEQQNYKHFAASGYV